MNYSGFVKINRQEVQELMDRLPINQRRAAKAFLFEGLLLAAWEPTQRATERAVVTLDRGQFTMSVRGMADELGLEVKPLRTLLATLQAMDEISLNVSPMGTVATLLRYDEYTGTLGQNGPKTGAHWGHTDGLEIGTLNTQENKEIDDQSAHQGHTDGLEKGTLYNKEERSKEVKEVQHTPRAREGDSTATAEPFETPTVTVTRDTSTPLSRTNAELLPPAADFDHEGLAAEAGVLARAYHRTHLLPAQLHRLVYVLHCDPTISPRLDAAKIRLILANWLKTGMPRHAHHLFRHHKKMDMPWWETCLHFAEKNAAAAPKDPYAGEYDILAGIKERTRR